MIYPKNRNKIRKFAGGGSSSLFDNPGSYLGIQYMPKAQELPDVEGLQYMMQLDQAKMAAAQQAKKNASATKNESYKNFEGMFDGLDGLSAEVSKASSEFNELAQNFINKYPTAEELNSPAANAEMSRIFDFVTRRTNEVKNNKSIYDKRYTSAEGVMPNYYFNNGNISIQNTEDPSEVRNVSYREFLDNKEGQYDKYQPMKISNLFDWTMKHSADGNSSAYNINQLSYAERQASIDSFFSNFATDTTSVSGGNLLKEELKKVGIEDPSKIDVADFKIKMQSGEMNAQALLNIFSRNMDPQVSNSIMSEMIEKGQDPDAIVGQTPEGDNITAFQNKVFELFTGEKIKKLSSSSDISITTQEEAEKQAETKAKEVPTDPVQISKINTVKGRLDDVDTFAYNNDLRETGYSDVYNQFKDKTDHTKVYVMDIDDSEFEEVLGHPPVYREITGGNRKVIAGGHEVTLREDFDPEGKGGAKYFETPVNNGLRVYDVSAPTADGRDVKIPQTTLDTYIYVNESALKNFKHTQIKNSSGDPVAVSPDNFKRTGYIQKVYKKDIEAEAQAYQAEATAKGLETKGDWALIPQWMGDKEYMYKVRIEAPFSKFTAANGISPSKATAEYIAQINEQANKKRLEQEKLAEQLKAEKVKSATEKLRKSNGGN